MSKVLDFANKRLDEEIKEKELGADNQSDINYWCAYRDGANAMQREWNKSVRADRLEGSVIKFVNSFVGYSNTLTGWRSELQLKSTKPERKDELTELIKNYVERIEIYEIRIAREFDKIIGRLENSIYDYKAENEITRKKGLIHSTEISWRSAQIDECKEKLELIGELKDYYEEAKEKIKHRETVEVMDFEKQREIAKVFGFGQKSTDF